MVKSISTYQSTGKKLERKENTSTTLTTIQKDISLDGSGLEDHADLSFLLSGSLNLQGIIPD